jgi:hypothetical protein
MVSTVSDKQQINESNAVNQATCDDYKVQNNQGSIAQSAEIEKQILLLKALKKELRNKNIIVSNLQKQKDQYLTLQKDYKLRNIEKDNYINMLENSYSLRIGRGVGKFIPQSVCTGIKKIFSRSGNQF